MVLELLSLSSTFEALLKCMKICDLDSFPEWLKGLLRHVLIGVTKNYNYSHNPPFQDKRCENGSPLLFDILHF